MSTEKDEVKEILETIAGFQLDQDLTEVQAAGLDRAAMKQPAKVPAEPLPTRKKINGR